LRWASRLRCFQRLSRTDIASQRCKDDNLTTGSPGIRPFRSSRTRKRLPQESTVAPDRDRAVLRRSEPSSRGVLTGEQTDPWDLLQPQDTPSRHRGADPPRRCGNLPIVTYGIRLYLYPFQDSNV